MKPPMDAETAAAFARAWVRAWNDHDLDAILAHYAEDVDFHSPRIRGVTGEDVSSLRGKAALRGYWGAALEQARELYFEIDQVFAGSDALTIVYTNHRQQLVAETFVFDASGKVVRAIAAYA
jgi:ketosteroid isomerase-like protein